MRQGDCFNVTAARSRYVSGVIEDIGFIGPLFYYSIIVWLMVDSTGC